LPFAQDPSKDAAILGRSTIVKGLDGMSRAADGDHDSFRVGHGAAAVIASVFFSRENGLDAATQQSILTLLEDRLLSHAVFAPRAPEAGDDKLVGGIVEDLDAGIGELRGSGHNIVFAVLSLLALREVPEAATAARVAGLRATVRSFGRGRSPRPGPTDAIPDVADEVAFARFLFAEYLAALDLYLGGRGHHGFAGHVLTVGHALVELARLGHVEIARRGLPAFAQFLRQARRGADLGGRRVPDPPKPAPGPLDRDYWAGQLRRPADTLVSSHLVKYPYAFHALWPNLADQELRQRAQRQIFHLTAVS
jgi:hypothetical protein